MLVRIWLEHYGIITIIDEFIMDAVALFNIINIANAAWSDCQIARSQRYFNLRISHITY